ncbi:unnamed protein product [Ixodes hexagonus]
MGNGTVELSTQVFTMIYFERLRGIAFGFTMAGVTLAGFVFPKLLLYLQNTYGFSRALLLVGAFSMNTTPILCLFRVPPWSHLPDRKGSTSSIRPLTSVYVVEEGANRQRPARIKTYLKLTLNMLAIPAMTRSPVFHIALWSTAATVTMDTMFLATITDFSTDKGLSLSDAVWVSSSFSTTDFLGRLCLPLLADRRYLRRSTLLMLTQFLTAAVMVATPFAATYWSIASIVALASCLVSCSHVLHDVLLVDYTSASRTTDFFAELLAS